MFITGAGFGLSLVLNVEQYEYIRSPNTDAGIKVQFKEPLKSSDILITTMLVVTLLTSLTRQKPGVFVRPKFIKKQITFL
jgi:hypothetical protein